MGSCCALLNLSKIRIIATLFALACLAAVEARPARAADNKVVAKAHYEAATRFYDIHEYAAALQEYKAGYLVRPDPSFLYNIGQCYKRLGQAKPAREFFREYLKKGSLDEQQRAQAEARLHELDLMEAEPPTSPPPPTAVDSSPSVARPIESRLISAAAILPEPAQPQPAGVDLSSSAPAPDQAGGSPFYRTWWFWTGVGAVVAAGLVTAVLLAKSDRPLNVGDTTLGSRKVLQ